MTNALTSCDVLILGGGVIGCSAAWWIAGADPSRRVVVVEPDPSYARAATALSVASVRQQFSNPVNVEISRFGVDFIRDFARRVGQGGGAPDLGLKENGYLFLAGDPGAAERLERLAAMQRSLGAATIVLDRDGLARRFPWMRLDDVVAGSLGQRDEGWFDNMGLLGGFRAGARDRGVTFVRDRATRLRLAGGRVTGADLGSGAAMMAAHVLVAAGTGAARLLASIAPGWPVEPRKRTVFVVDAPGARHPDAPLVIDHTGIYLRPEHEAWIAATVPSHDGPCAEDDFAPDHAQFEDAVWPMLYNRAEGFGAAKVRRLWVGHYDYNRLDQNAFVGPHPSIAGLYVANGFSGHGLQQAPAVGRALAEIILTGAYRTLDLAPLGLERLMRNEPFLEEAIV